jgi:hypothetical protein
MDEITFEATLTSRHPTKELAFLAVRFPRFTNFLKRAECSLFDQSCDFVWLTPLTPTTFWASSINNHFVTIISLDCSCCHRIFLAYSISSIASLIHGDKGLGLAAYIHDKLGMQTAKDVSIVGAWVGDGGVHGAENSIMTLSNADWDHSTLAAAMMGHLADQKSVLVFKEEKDGKSTLSHFEAKGSLEDIHLGRLPHQGDSIRQHRRGSGRGDGDQ